MRTWQWLSASALCALAVVVSGCGAKKANGPSSSPPAKAERGGTLRMLSSTDVDFLDPGRTVISPGLMVFQATQRPLYRYLPTSLRRPLPDMAASAPLVSADGRTVTVRLRRGVRFSPPVSREVTSADVAYAFDRIFSANLAAPYAAYFRALEGVPATPTDGVKRISGITTPGRYTIRFRLQPDSGTPAFVGALVLPVTAPIPQEYAARFDARSPSTYNEHVVATGPYMVRNDAAGRTVGYRPGESIDLVRNPSWSRATDTRPALLDAIQIQTNATDTTVAADQVLHGSQRALLEPPPPTVLKRVAGDREGRVSARVDTGGYRFVSINTTLRPFDDVDVRRAVLAVFDRVAARKARGGASAGAIATHFLGPGIAGFEEAGGLRGTGPDFLRRPAGDAALAATYMRRAGYSDGRYHGAEQFLLVSGNDPTDKGIAQVTQAQFEKLGFRTKLKLVPPDSLFTTWCGTPAKRVLSCASSIAWLKDFPDPEPMLRPVFHGESIAQTNNTNFSELDDPALNRAMNAASPLSGSARAKAWGAVDRRLVDLAPAVPIDWDVATLIHSPDVAGVASVYFDGWDLSYTGIRAK